MGYGVGMYRVLGSGCGVEGFPKQGSLLEPSRYVWAESGLWGIRIGDSPDGFEQIPLSHECKVEISGFRVNAT